MSATVPNSIRIDVNIATNYLIWLDSPVNKSEENIQAQQILRASINRLLTFDDDELCLQYIGALSNDDRVVLIVSGRLGQIFVPQVAFLRQIESIYVYCMNKKVSEQWARHFIKVNMFTWAVYKRREMAITLDKMCMFCLGKRCR